MKKINIIVLFICGILFLLPFFWLSPGELEMGGDSNRLFLYDPGSYLQVNALYSVEPLGVGKVGSNQNMLPFLILLDLLNQIFHSPYLLMTLLNSVKLFASFLFVYLTVVEILSHNFGKTRALHVGVAGILAGLLYALSPSVGENIRSALLTHNQVFLNPMIFYLVLRFLVTEKSKYLWFALLTTFVFSPNFSLMAPPPPFAFYPLAFLFLILYSTYCLKKSLPWKKLLLGFSILLGIHAFHLLPAVAHILDPSSDYYVRALDATSGRNEALDYFNATLGLGRVSKQIFLAYADNENRWAMFIAPLIIILGFLLSKKLQKSLMLIAIFFFVTLFLMSANITQIGVEIYRMFFYIPGFSMFRVFYGQWQWVYAFFYALLFGYCLYILLLRLKLKIICVLSVVFVALVTLNSWTFVSGQILRAIHPGSKNMTSIVKINPDYEEAHSFVKSLPDDGKLFSFPFNDFFYQVVPGTNNAAYIGPSFTSYLTGKRMFSGYQTIYPFPEVFLKLIKEKNYIGVKRLFGLLNVKYIFYAKDPKAFVEYYPTWPYSLFLSAISNSQNLMEYIDAVRGKKIFENDNYAVYESSPDMYLPHFYVPVNMKFYDGIGDWHGKNVSFFVDDGEEDPRIGYIDREQCKKIFSASTCARQHLVMESDVPKVSFQRINPVKYTVKVRGATRPFVLVFSDQFHKDWKLFLSKPRSEQLPVLKSYFNESIQEFRHKNIFWYSLTFETFGIKSLPEEQHFLINGYANAWYITSDDIIGNQDFEIIIEMSQQRLFYYGLGITLLSLGIFFGYGVTLFRR